MIHTLTDLDWAKFDARRIDLATRFVGSVLPDPGQLLPAAERAGIGPSMIDDDLGLIYQACIETRDGSPIDAVVRAWEKLEAAGYWVQKATPGSTGMQWSNETLIAYSRSWFPCAAIVEAYARRLIDALAREQEVRELQARIDGLVTGELQPARRDASAALPKHVAGFAAEAA